MRERHEWKHEINASDLLALRRRLRAVMDPDRHGRDGRYFVRSLYFDDPSDRALREKLDGVSRREKFRLRCYDGDAVLILLEKKSKISGLCRKESAPLPEAEARAHLEAVRKQYYDARHHCWCYLLNGGRPDRLGAGLPPLLWELCQKMRTQLLRPRTIVDYTREAYVFGPGNVRVTMDWDIRTGLGGTDFLDFGCVTVPAGGAPAILEVKWDAFLPDVIRDAVQLEGRRTAPFSKYAACRIYG